MSSSDDDIMGLLPSGRGRGRGAAAPSRLKNFKAMMSDSSDDEKKPANSKAAAEKKGLPVFGQTTSKPSTPVPAPLEVPTAAVSAPATPVVATATTPRSAATAVSPTRAQPPPLPQEDSSSDDDDDSSSNSIQFLEDAAEENTDEVSMDLHSSNDASPKKVASKTLTAESKAPPSHKPADPPAERVPAKAEVSASATISADTKSPTAQTPSAAPVAVTASKLNSPAKQQQSVVSNGGVSVAPPSSGAPQEGGKQSAAAPPAVTAAAVIITEDPRATAPKALVKRPSSPPKAKAVVEVAPMVEETQSYDPEAEESELLQDILPLPPKTQRPVAVGTQQRAVGGQPPMPQNRTRSPSANSVLMNGATTQQAPASPPKADPLMDLLIRAQHRLKEKEKLDQTLPPQPTAANLNGSFTVGGSRASSPFRPLGGDPKRSLSATTQGQALDLQGGGQQLFSSQPTTSDAARELRLQKENMRLSEELSYLTRENQKLRSADAQTASNEISKLQVHVEVLKQQLREAEMDAQRTKAYLEAQVQDAEGHARELSEEVKHYAQTSSQFDSILKEKDIKIVEVQKDISKLQTNLQEKTQEVRRVEDEAKRQRDDDRARYDRDKQLFEDVKKQRVQLQELNDKFLKDKEQAVSDRRRVSEELRLLQQELQRERDKHGDELSALRRDTERYRQLLSEKERAMNAQIAEERRAKEHFQSRLAELEDTVSSESQVAQQQLKAAQEEYRRAAEDWAKKQQQYTEQIQTMSVQLDAVHTEYAVKIQKEKSVATKESTEKSIALKEQRDAAEERRRAAEEQLERALQERDHYRKEWEKATDLSSQWQKAKDKAELQCAQLGASLQQLIAQDEQLMQENERLRVELDQCYNDVANLRADLDACYQMEQQLQDLTAENDRISDECTRVTQERNELIGENAKMAEEMIKWRNEVRDMFSSQKRTSSSVSAANTVRSGSLSQRLVTRGNSEFSF